MKKNLGIIILVFLLVVITAFLAYIIVSKQHTPKQVFNIKKGDVIEFAEYNINATILNVASTLCDNKDTCVSPGEIEVSVKIDYEGNISNYKLQSVNNPEQRIKKSNYYLTLSYEEDKILLDIIEK
ncbi:MAG: hypothetical protein E7167_02465 [Firmicutes bacterium]|nr:hypothetical protein [Bacillota bacterium]